MLEQVVQVGVLVRNGESNEGGKLLKTRVIGCICYNAATVDEVV